MKFVEFCRILAELSFGRNGIMVNLTWLNGIWQISYLTNFFSLIGRVMKLKLILTILRCYNVTMLQCYNVTML